MTLDGAVRYSGETFDDAVHAALLALHRGLGAIGVPADASAVERRDASA